MTIRLNNIFDNLPDKPLAGEVIETLFENERIQLERIVTAGQTTPKDEWYDQGQDEWVLLLKGQATLVFEDEQESHLSPGDYLFIETHKKHRVSWTSPDEVCV